MFSGESPSASTQLSKGSMLGSVQSLDAAKFSFTPDYSVRAITEVCHLIGCFLIKVSPTSRVPQFL